MELETEVTGGGARQRADAATLPAHPEKDLVYASPQIQERRQRILLEARNLIAEEGIEGFSIRKLCARAGVVQRTLYNAFHSKERIIALAIWNTYEEAHRKVRYQTDADTVVGVLDRMISVNRRNLRSPNYAKAIVALYFSPGLSRDIHGALLALVHYQRLWLVRVAAAGCLKAGAVIDDIVSDLANLEYSIIHDWSEGRLSGDRYLLRLARAFLTYALSVTVSGEHDEVARILDALAGSADVAQFHDRLLAA